MLTWHVAAPHGKFCMTTQGKVKINQNVVIRDEVTIILHIFIWEANSIQLNAG